MTGKSQLGFAEFGFQIQHHQQAPKADELPDHHAEFQDLFVAEMLFYPVKKVVIHIVMVYRHSVGIFQR
jgi:hypothetical protein